MCSLFLVSSSSVHDSHQETVFKENHATALDYVGSPLVLLAEFCDGLASLGCWCPINPLHNTGQPTDLLGQQTLSGLKRFFHQLLIVLTKITTSLKLITHFNLIRSFYAQRIDACRCKGATI